MSSVRVGLSLLRTIASHKSKFQTSSVFSARSVTRSSARVVQCGFSSTLLAHKSRRSYDLPSGSGQRC